MIYTRIRLRNGPQKFRAFFGDKFFTVSILYRDAEAGGGWYADFVPEDGSSPLYGVPLLTGEDLWGQFDYLNWGHLWVVAEAGDADLSAFEGLTENVSLIWGGD